MSQLIPPQQLLSLLKCFAPCFTSPSFRYFVSFIVAMIAATERLTTTTVYRISSQVGHYTNCSRFLSGYRWSVCQLSQQLLSLLVQRLGLWRDDQGRPRLCLVLDETIVEKSSKRKPGTPISVHEPQMLLRRACELEGTFALVERSGGHINKSKLAAAAQYAQHLTVKSAEP